MITIIYLLCIHINLWSQNNWDKERHLAKEQITEKILNTNISFLSDSLCNGRGTGSLGNVEAAFWIQRQFEEAGLLKFGDSYAKGFMTDNGKIGRNIIGLLPGSYTMPREKYIIVGAHFDHLGVINDKMYPGADSNASGVVAMTSLGEIFSAMKEMGMVYDQNIIFVAFDAKEHGMKGSEKLWEMLTDGKLANPLNGKVITKDKISLMVNIDQIGSSLSPINEGITDYLLMLGTESLNYRKRKLLEECNKTHSTGLDICLSYYGSQNFTKVFYRISDQKVFVDNHIPAVMFTSGITMNNNKVRDTAETLDMNAMKKRVMLIYHWIEGMM